MNLYLRGCRYSWDEQDTLRYTKIRNKTPLAFFWKDMFTVRMTELSSTKQYNRETTENSLGSDKPLFQTSF